LGEVAELTQFVNPEEAYATRTGRFVENTGKNEKQLKKQGSRAGWGTKGKGGSFNPLENISPSHTSMTGKKKEKKETEPL